MSYEAMQIIHPSAAEAAGGNVSFSAANGSTVCVWVNVTAAGTTITFSMQWSGDGATYGPADPADTFTAITTTGAVAKTFTRKAPFCRLVWTLTGSFTFEARAGVIGA
jgi:hypothetical protein